MELPAGHGAIPYRPGPAMKALAEQRGVGGTYRTCIHRGVTLSQDTLGSKHAMKNNL